MRPDSFFFPDEFSYEGQTFYGQKIGRKNEIHVALIDETCPFDIGGILIQKQGGKERQFEVLDYDVNQSLGVGGAGYPFNALLQVKALDVKEKASPITTHITFNAAVTAGGDFQAGSINTAIKKISIEQLQDAIERSEDPEVKGLWQKLLENPTFATIAATLAQGALSS